MSISALNSGFNGIQTSLKHLRYDAQRIATARSDADDVTAPLLDLHRDKTHVLAATKVVRAADAMIGSLLDIKV